MNFWGSAVFCVYLCMLCKQDCLLYSKHAFLSSFSLIGHSVVRIIHMNGNVVLCKWSIWKTLTWNPSDIMVLIVKLLLNWQHAGFHKNQWGTKPFVTTEHLRCGNKQTVTIVYCSYFILINCLEMSQVEVHFIVFADTYAQHTLLMVFYCYWKYVDG